MNLLEKITLLEKEADDFGFRWETTEQIMEQIKSECTEVSEHLNIAGNYAKTQLQEEIGDLLHAVFSLCVFCQFSPEETLEKTLSKFDRRLQAVKNLAAEKGLQNLQGRSFEELMDFWKQAKCNVG